jgi:hypothetical protein
MGVAVFPEAGWVSTAIGGVMEYRNEIIRMLGKLDVNKHLALLSSNTFQAGLDALDPDCPCFVQDRAIQECIYLGLRYQVLMA